MKEVIIKQMKKNEIINAHDLPFFYMEEIELGYHKKHEYGFRELVKYFSHNAEKCKRIEIRFYEKI